MAGDRLARIDVELPDAVKLARLALGGLIALALFGNDMDKRRRIVFLCGKAYER